MATTSNSKTGRRTLLSRDRVVQAALGYIDVHGLDGLSMHKLGAELGVQGMSLYNHVANKDDVLDGVVELLWAEVETAAPATPNWRAGYRTFAHALREGIHRHPNAAPLIYSQGIAPEAALRCVQAHVTAATDSGTPEPDAYALLRTLSSYALGTALNEVSWGTYEAGCAAAGVDDLVRPGVPEELHRIAEIFCGQSDPDAEFELGLDLMLRDPGNTRQAPTKTTRRKPSVGRRSRSDRVS